MGNRQVLASEVPFGIRKHVERLEALVDALHTMADEVLSREQVDKVEFIREYRQALKDAIAVRAKYRDALDDELINQAILAGIEELEDPAAEERFMKGFRECLENEYEELSEPGEVSKL